MPAKLNLIDQHFGKLTVEKETSIRKNKSVVWSCRCECGNIENFSTKELRSDGIIQCSKCGNKRKPQNNLLENIIDRKFNHLLVTEKSKYKSCGKILYACKCDCGNENVIYATRTDLQSGHTKSCGCIKRKYNIGDVINNRKILKIIGKKDNGRFYYLCQCLLCGTEYEALAQTLDKSIGCGCQKSKGEFNIIKILKENDIPYLKEYSFKNSNYRFDFALLDKDNNIIRLVEFDGEQHFKENIKNSGWNTKDHFEYVHKNDLEKNKLAKEQNIPLVRIPYTERESLSLDKIFSDTYII